MKLYLGDPMTVYKGTTTHQVEVMRSIPPSSHELLEYSAHSIVTLFFFNKTYGYYFQGGA
jgi:hypothetical protein